MKQKPVLELWFLVLLCFVAQSKSYFFRQSSNNNQQEQDGNNNNMNIDDSSPVLAAATVPLHAASGTHHVHVYIGSPPQRQTLIVDTGSRLMAFPCAPCTSCGKHTSPYFDPYKSTTDRTPVCQGKNPASCLLKGISKCSDVEANNNNSSSGGVGGRKCIISQKYTEGSSWSAYEKEDLVWLGSNDFEQSYDEFMELAVPYVFGCQTTERGLFRKQYADGILGMAIHPTSFVSALYDAKSIQRLAFSLCMTKSGGTMGLGGIARGDDDEKTPMRFTPIQRDHGWFALKVTAVKLNGICLACDNSTLLSVFDGGKGTILDSGTTDSYLPQAIASVFSKVWTEITGVAYSKRKRKYTYAQFQRLPTLEFTFWGNATLQVEPKNYMEGVVEPWSGTKELVNRIYLDEQEGAVLGANMMFGHEILYDIEGKRVGIAKTTCRQEQSGVHSQSYRRR